MAEINNYEPPKMAAIRLLKSQGCCQCDTAPSQSSEIARMMKYKEELQMRVVQERSRLNEIPCAITLAEEIEQLREVVNGLGRENRNRLEQLRKVKVRAGQTITLQANESQQQIEHERLQQEYANLLRTLEGTNENNRRLVQRLTRY